jgi:hypothetical protein
MYTGTDLVKPAGIGAEFKAGGDGGSKFPDDSYQGRILEALNRLLSGSHHSS